MDQASKKVNVVEQVEELQMNLKIQGELIVELNTTITELVAKVNDLSKPVSRASEREMTDEDARRILNGDLREKSHKDAAKELNLSYGQVYSCRGLYTFKHIHKEMQGIEGYKNIWAKS